MQISKDYQNFHDLKVCCDQQTNISVIADFLNNAREEKSLPDSTADFLEKVCHRLDNEGTKLQGEINKRFADDQKAVKKRQFQVIQSNKALARIKIISPMTQPSQIKEQTRVYNGIRGWTGETITKNKAGQLYKITTLKRSNKKVSSVATEIDEAKKENGMQIVVITDMLTKPSIKLIESDKRATEKLVREQHAKAVLLFDQQDESKPSQQQPTAPKDNPIRRGLNFFMWGYGNESHPLVLLEVTESGYKFLNLKKYTTGFASRLKPYSEKFGIGYYYNDKAVSYFDENAIADGLIKANEKSQALEQAKDKAEQERQAKIKIGMEKLCVPHYAEAVIVANLVKDTSDVMSDYFAKSTVETVYLDWSKTKRNDFKEMRKASKKFIQTQHFNEVKESKHERRENYTGGSGYYLAESTYSGWQVKKESYLDLKADCNKEMLAIAIAEGRFLCDDEPEIKKPVVTEASTEDMELLKYSERSFVLLGETRAHAETLGRKGLQLKFNRFLTHPETKEKVPGWVIPNKRVDEVKQALNM